MSLENVILVDEQDQAVGTMEKMEAHRQGLLHRAFSVFMFDGEKRLLLQQRALHKYHSAGLWTNTCCSHPRPDEATVTAAIRRLEEEMGLQAAPAPAFTFRYRAPVGGGLIEHEIDHVFVAYSNQDPILNPDEAADFRWAGLEEIERWVTTQPQRFTAWFKHSYRRVFAYVEDHYST